MKKINSILLLSVCMLLATFTSCMDDLNTSPKGGDQLVDPWGNPETYEQYIAKLYACLAISGNNGPSGHADISGADEGETTFIRHYWNLQELPTDEAIVAWSDDGLDGLNFCKWNATNRFCELAYNRALLTVMYANEYLRNTTEEELNDRGIDAATKAKVQIYRNEAKAIRAFQYFILMDLFGSVPFADESSDVGSGLPEQKTRAWIFNWVESELKSLEGNLPEKSATNYGKMNNPIIWMILAKMYMNAEVYIEQKKYTEAITYLNKILNAGYSLQANYSHLFGADNHQSSEVIFPIVFDGIEASCYGGVTYLMAAAFASDMEPGKNYGLDASWSGIRAKESLTTIFGSNDKRAMFYTNDRTQEATNAFDYKTGWAVVKFTNIVYSESTEDNKVFGKNNQFPDTDFPFFRLADAYLMYAEAVLRGGTGGSRADALSYVNEIRNRANAGEIADADLTLDFLLEERARELYWEGHRRTDLIRFGKFTKGYAWPWKNGVRTGTSSISDIYKLFPIPASEMSANVTLTQNTGY